MSTSHHLNLDHIVTDQKGTVLHIELEKTHSLRAHLFPGRPIHDSFHRWENHGTHFIVAEKEETFLFYKLEEKTQCHYILLKSEEWVQQEEKLRHLSQKANELEAMIENSFDGIYITDSNGVTLRTNSAIERITGIPKSYYLGKNIHQLMKRGFLTESVTVQVMEQKQPVSIVQRNQHGKETLMTGSPIFNSQGEIDKIVTNIRDLTELKSIHDTLNRTKALKDKLAQNKMEDSDFFETFTHPKMKDIYDLITRLASFDPTLLILGETGVGKDVLVKRIYQTGLRSETGQLIKVNCGAIPKDLIESELFGYERGSFSGANRAGKAGLFELANKGILFLDEIAEMPLDLQVKLLHIIQEKEMMRVGGTRPIKLDVQVIAATNKNLKKMVDQGTFREDLYYRLNVVPIEIPPLRERKEDLKGLIHHSLNTLRKKYQISKSFSDSALNRLYDYNWPGNLRELANVMERLVLTVTDTVIQEHHLPKECHTPAENNGQPFLNRTLKEQMEEVERAALVEALKTGRSTYDLAKQLGTSQATMVRKLKKYHLSTIEA